MDLEKLSDSEFYQLCKKYGSNAKLWTKKFAGLLPEAKRRRIYRRRGCSSLYEFASKLGGMNHNQVDRILRLSHKLKNKPTLKKLLETGEQGWSKIEAVAFIATPKTEKEWAEKVEKLPLSVLSEYIKKERKVIGADNLQSEKWAKMSFPVSPKVEIKLRQFKQKYEQETGETLAWNEIFEKMCKELEAGTKQAKEKTTIQLCPECTQKKGQAKKSGAMPRDVQRLVRTRQKNKCFNCNNPIKIFHHTKRFALKSDHDPDSIIGLCEKCHTLAHSSLVANEQEPNWQILESPDYKSTKWRIDQKILNYRRDWG
jgi:hypothetical protein